MTNCSKTILIILLLVSGLFSEAKEIWVSPSGDDSNPGTKVAPLKTILMAQRKAREIRRLNQLEFNESIEIILKRGVYQLDETLFFRPEDSGTELSKTIIKAAVGEEPVISGGITVNGWEKIGNIKGLPTVSKGKIWIADIPRVGGRQLEFRQLWVNGKKAVRASNLNDGILDRILSVDKKGEAIWIPSPKVDFKSIGQLELVIHQWWAIANLRVKAVEKVGDSTKVTFHQPESRIEFEHPWPAPFIDENKDQNGNSAFYFANAPELLNQPGEWYEDLDAGKIYYWPRKDENMKSADVVVPFLETLVKIEGSPDHPVSNINFEGINFQFATWMRPSQAGHVPLQAGFYLLDAYKLEIPGTPDKASLENQAWVGRQSGGVTVSGANNINFQQCSFEHMAATGLDFVKGVNNCQVKGCVFEDIGGTGIQAGFFGDATFEAHLPYDPSDEREVCHHILISNNLVTNCTNEDWGCVGISVGYAHDITVEHNEISHVNYSGICVGWGWTPTVSCLKNNRIVANHIHHFAKNMYDVGGIYMLSVQPNTEISRNYIHDLIKAPYAHIPEHYQYIYLDERSSYIRINSNWTEKDKFFSNTPGPGNEWDNNGPDVSDEIKNAAGIQDDYQNLPKPKFDP